MEILEAVGIVVAVWLGGYLVVHGDLTPGAFMGFLGRWHRCMSPSSDSAR